MATFSKPLLINLNRDRSYLTRYQERRIRQTFPFLNLPLELRNIIYDLSINLKGIEKYFDEFYGKVRFRGGSTRKVAPARRRKTPAILLVNRQIFAEAISLLSKRGISFHHGLLGLSGVHEIVSPDVLQRISSITITTKGHEILRSNILQDSWCGYMNLITHLSTILSEGHNLKNLVIDLSDPALVIHITKCWDDCSTKCDFRNHMKEAFNNLRVIRGVNCVTIKGIPATLARELKTHMESKPISFLDLPGEIRNNVYELSGDWSDITPVLARTMKLRSNHNTPPPYPKRSTPTILLLNRQIRNEALSVLHSKPLNIVFPEAHDMYKQTEVPSLLNFIATSTLQKVQHLSIKIETWEWIYAIDELAQVLASAHSLKTFHIVVKDRLKAQFLAAPMKKYPDWMLHKNLGGLVLVRGVKHVTIEGDLPDVYADPLAQIMQTPVGTTSLPPLQALLSDGNIININVEA